jgi:hypothetical protein
MAKYTQGKQAEKTARSFAGNDESSPRRGFDITGMRPLDAWTPLCAVAVAGPACRFQVVTRRGAELDNWGHRAPAEDWIAVPELWEEFEAFLAEGRDIIAEALSRGHAATRELAYRICASRDYRQFLGLRPEGPEPTHPLRPGAGLNPLWLAWAAGIVPPVWMEDGGFWLG